MIDIKLNNIYLNFQKKEILKNFSLSFDERDKVLIRGKSGIGKSTIIKILMGFQYFDKGEYLINEKPFSQYNISDVRKKYAYIDQDISIRKITVNKYLEEISKFNNNSFKSPLNPSLCEYFEFDPQLVNEQVQKLSGGEKQRLAIIIAIMLDRPIFLLDEITSALDSSLKKKVAQYFSSTSKGVIVISHDDVWLEGDNFRQVEL